MENEETFGAWLRRRRKAMGLTVQQAADRCGVTKSYVSALELDRSNGPRQEYAPPSKKTVDRIADGLGIDKREARIAAGYLPSVDEVERQPSWMVLYDALPQHLQKIVEVLVGSLYDAHMAGKTAELLSHVRTHGSGVARRTQVAVEPTMGGTGGREISLSDQG